jgi:hypothetical protein
MRLPDPVAGLLADSSAAFLAWFQAQFSWRFVKAAIARRGVDFYRGSALLDLRLRFDRGTQILYAFPYAELWPSG